MIEVAENIVDIQPIRSAVQRLIEIRRKLAHNMLVRLGGFEYETVFGCSAPADDDIPHVAVRVELKCFDESESLYRFEVYVDFELPSGVDVKTAEHYRRAVNNAVKQATWAREMVYGHVWDLKTIMSLEVE